MHRIPFIVLTILLAGIAGAQAPAQPLSRADGDSQDMEWIGGWPGGLSQACAMQPGRTLHGDGRWLVISRVDGAHLVEVSRLALPAEILDLALAGDVAYAVLAGLGLAAVDLADDAAPTIATVVELPGSPRSVAVRDHVVGVAADGFVVLDATDPLAPQVVAIDDHVGQGLAVTAAAPWWFVGDAASGLWLYDLSTPAAPVVAGAYAATNVSAIEPQGQLVYVGRLGAAMQILDVSDPQDIQPVGTPPGITNVTDIAVEWSTMLVTSYDRLLRVYSLADPLSPQQLSQLYGTGEARAIDVYDDTAVVVCTHGGAYHVRIEPPASPAVLDQVSATGFLTRAATTGDLTAVASMYRGVLLFDTSDPAQPRQVGAIEITHPVAGIELIGTRLYVLSAAILDIIDVSTPTAPDVLSSTVLYDGDDLLVDGDYVYIARSPGTSSRFLDVYDTADPQSVARVASLTLPVVDQAAVTLALDLAGDLVAVTGGYQGCWLVDVISPEWPDLVAHVEPDGAFGALSSVIVGPLLYVLNAHHYSLDIFAIADPAQPIRSYPWFPSAREFVRGDGVLYVAGLDAGPYVLDTSDPLAPVVCAYFDTPGRNDDLAIIGDVLVAPCFDGGLQVVRWRPHLTPVAPPALAAAPSLSCEPNPFNPRTTITFDLSAPGHAALRIYDLNGRLVRTLYDGEAAAGAHPHTWTGDDGQGRSVASGVYVARLELRGETVQQAVTLIR